MSKEIMSTFTSEDGKIILPVLTDVEDVWLNQKQLSILYGVSQQTISEHVANALKEECQDSTNRNFLCVQTEGKRQVERSIEHYNLDVILSVGYRVKSKRGIEFRRWANQILKERIMEMIKATNAKVKELLPYKHKVEHQEAIACEYRTKSRGTCIKLINIETGKLSTLWKVPLDVKKYLYKYSKYERGLLFDKWKRTHNFYEFIRYRIEKGI